MEVLLKVLYGDDHVGQETTIPLPKCLIGRNSECHLRFQHPAVSRRHCVVYVRQGRVFVRDLGSHNGTSLNGRLLCDDQELKTGDELQLGPVFLEVQILLDIFADEPADCDAAHSTASQLPVVSSQSIRGVDKDSIAAWLAKGVVPTPQDAANDSQTRLIR